MSKIRASFHQVAYDKLDFKYKPIGFNRLSEDINSLDEASLIVWLCRLLREWHLYKSSIGAKGFKFNEPINIQVIWQDKRFHYTQQSIKLDDLKKSIRKPIAVEINRHYYKIVPCDSFLTEIKSVPATNTNSLTKYLDSINYCLIDFKHFKSPIIYTGWIN